jgi:hypothetical protein
MSKVKTKDKRSDKDRDETAGYSSYDYDTDDAFDRFLRGDEEAEEEFFHLLDRDVEKRVSKEEDEALQEA